MKRIEPYCLKCYTPLEPNTVDCPVCGFKNHKWLRKRYWTLDRGLLALEYTLKTLIFILCMVVTIAILLVLRGGGPSSGWIIALPVVALGYGLWETASKITKKIPYFSPTFFWGSAFTLLSFVGLVIDIRMTIICVVSVVLVNVAGYELRKWKHRKIAKPNTT